LTRSASATAQVCEAVPSDGFTVIEVALSASIVPRTSRWTLGFGGFVELQRRPSARRAASAPAPEPIAPAVSPAVFENVPVRLPSRAPSPLPAWPRIQASSVPFELMPATWTTVRSSAARIFSLPSTQPSPFVAL
jgi:hypothetical protein